MSERDRARRLHVENRLAELNAKLGPVETDLPPGARARLDPVELAHLVALHRDMLALERSRQEPDAPAAPAPRPTPAPPAARPGLPMEMVR